MKNLKSLLSFFLAQIIVSASILSITPASASAASYKTTGYWNRGSSWAYYNQASPIWYQVSGYTSKNNGCSVTAFATAAAILYNNKKITPKVIAAIAKSKGYWDLRGPAPRDLVMRLASYAHLKYRKLARTCKKGDCPIATALIKQRAILVVRASGSKPFTPSGHYVAVVGADNKGYLKVVDPGHSAYRPKKMYYKTFLNAMSSSNYTIFALSLR